MHTKKVDDLIKNKKYFILICKIDFGIKTMQEKIVDKQRAENPINEIIYNLFSTDCFFLILFYRCRHIIFIMFCINFGSNNIIIFIN